MSDSNDASLNEVACAPDHKEPLASNRERCTSIDTVLLMPNYDGVRKTKESSMADEDVSCRRFYAISTDGVLFLRALYQDACEHHRQESGRLESVIARYIIDSRNARAAFYFSIAFMIVFFIINRCRHVRHSRLWTLLRAR